MDSPLFYQLGEAFTGKNKWKERQNKYAADLAGMTTAAQMDAQLTAAEKGRDMAKQRALGEFGTMGMSPEDAAKAYARAANSGLMTDATTALKAEGYMPHAKQIGAEAGEADILGNQARGAKARFDTSYDTGATEGAEEAGRTKTKAEIWKNRLSKMSSALDIKDAPTRWDDARTQRALDLARGSENLNTLTTANQMGQQQLAEFMTPGAIAARSAMTGADRARAEAVPEDIVANRDYRKAAAERYRAFANQVAKLDPAVVKIYTELKNSPEGFGAPDEVLLERAKQIQQSLGGFSGTSTFPTTAVRGDNPPRPAASSGRATGNFYIKE